MARTTFPMHMPLILEEGSGKDHFPYAHAPDSGGGEWQGPPPLCICPWFWRRGVARTPSPLHMPLVLKEGSGKGTLPSAYATGSEVGG